MASQGPQIQFGVPFTPMVKKLVIINMVIWVGAVLILQNWVLREPLVFEWFGLIPRSLVIDFWVWQPFTYMFVHSENVFHVLFNMLVLWMFGAELEARWGGRFFLLYYLVCGVGAAFLYVAAILAYYLITNDIVPLQAPVVGASGAIFGLMLAYGMMFGERVIYFMMMIPMKAKMFVLLIGVVEILNLLSSGVSGQTANLAHLGGLVAGYLFLRFWDYWQGRTRRRAAQKHGRKLKLVVNNPADEASEPRYWN